ncbi:MAG: metallophosphoesterase [Armatimonadota bacterium]
MRLLAISDPHYDDESRPRVEAIAKAVCAADADVLIVAGDCSADGVERVGEVLALFEAFDGARLMVPGNHDLWEHEQPFSTRRLYEETIPNIAVEHGFHCLDQGPSVVDGTAFVGVMGWYDYEMRQRRAPVDGLTVTPIEVARGDDGRMSFAAVEGAGETGWEALGADDYAAGGLIWQEGDATPEVAVWNDVLHLGWEQSAHEVAAEMAQRLRGQIDEIAGECERVVGVTHFVPFAELAEHQFEHPKRAYARAFLGSPLLGEALLRADDLALVIHGHRHRQDVREVHGVVTADANVSGDDGPLLLTLPD